MSDLPARYEHEPRQSHAQADEAAYGAKIRAHKANGETGEPLVMLTAYTAQQAQLLDAHCDILLVGDSLAR